MAIKAWLQFIKLESSAGIILIFMAILAIFFDNSSLHPTYDALLKIKLDIPLLFITLSKPLLLWINDGLMVIFFFLVGLEIKREMLVGELNSWRKSALPGIAAIGGMIVPALIYCLFNRHDSVLLRGWAIPTATDIAFSLAILSLLGSRIPIALKVFLTALAIFDDIGAIVIIGVFYTQQIIWGWLVVAAVLVVLLFFFHQRRVTRLSPYLLVGLLLWLCVLKSGIHATIAGIIAAMMIPIEDPKNPDHSPLNRLEDALHPWVAFVVLPLFAFANAGVRLVDIPVSTLMNTVSLGIMGGLFFGKQLGIGLASWLAIRFGWARLPYSVTFQQIYAVGLLAGVGFTMSLFVGGLAFSPSAEASAESVRLGVIIGSLCAGVTGYLMLRYSKYQRTKPTKC